jgi:hypothetical protein
MSNRKYFKGKRKKTDDRPLMALIGASRNPKCGEHTLIRQCYRCKHPVYLRPIIEQQALQKTETILYICEVCFFLPDAADHFLTATE